MIHKAIRLFSERERKWGGVSVVFHHYARGPCLWIQRGGCSESVGSFHWGINVLRVTWLFLSEVHFSHFSLGSWCKLCVSVHNRIFLLSHMIMLPHWSLSLSIWIIVDSVYRGFRTSANASNKHWINRWDVHENSSSMLFIPNETSIILSVNGFIDATRVQMCVCCSSSTSLRVSLF